jgi:3'-5' exoribonuclease
MKEKYVEEIREGESVVEHFLVSSRELLTTRNGNPYISLTLQDKTGSIDGKIWDRAQHNYSLFQRDDFVKVDALAESYRGVLQLNIKRIRKSEAEEVSLEDFLPGSERPAKEMQEELLTLLGSVENPHLKGLLDAFLSDQEFMSAFSEAPAARGVHHVYLGGLLEHTISVLKLCSFLADFYPEVDRDLLLTAAMFHDVGKVRELSVTPSIDYTDEGRLIGHTLLGVEIVAQRAGELQDFPPQLLTLIEHAVISHHGLLEFGAVKRPKTVEALLLHYADDIDAKVNAFRRIISEDRDPDSSWTSYNRLLDRYIFKGWPEGNSPEGTEEEA